MGSPSILIVIGPQVKDSRPHSAAVGCNRAVSWHGDKHNYCRRQTIRRPIRQPVAAVRLLDLSASVDTLHGVLGPRAGGVETSLSSMGDVR